MKDVIIVTGSLPPDVCGVGDYAHNLAQALADAGTSVRFFYRSDWSFRSALRNIREIRTMQPSLINIQHPTAGYGYSLVPQLIAWFCGKPKTIVTLHEFSRRTLKGKVALYLFFLHSDWLIFTTDEEFRAARAVAPWIAGRSSVIPIGSNIPFRHSSERDIDLAYFGLIRPDKGLEAFVSTLGSVYYRRKIVSCIIGNVSPDWKEYAANLESQVSRYGTRLILNRSSEEVAEYLSRVRVVLLPFPDGMSLRRGSAFAAMGNGALVLSLVGDRQSAEIDRICVTVDSEAALANKLEQILETYELYDGIRVSGQQFAQTRTWSGTAASYRSVMNNLIPKSDKGDLG